MTNFHIWNKNKISADLMTKMPPGKTPYDSPSTGLKFSKLRSISWYLYWYSRACSISRVHLIQHLQTHVLLFQSIDNSMDVKEKQKCCFFIIFFLCSTLNMIIFFTINTQEGNIQYKLKCKVVSPQILQFNGCKYKLNTIISAFRPERQDFRPACCC